MGPGTTTTEPRWLCAVLNPPFEMTYSKAWSLVIIFTRLRTVTCPHTAAIRGFLICATNNFSELRLRREAASTQRINSCIACLNAKLRALHLPPFSFRNTETVQLPCAPENL